MQLAANRTRAARPPQLCHDDTPSRPIVNSGRLVYARPEDLPSFPSIGFEVSAHSAAAAAAAAATAATLGRANKKSPEPSGPGNSRSTATIAANMAVIMAENNNSARAKESVSSSQGPSTTALLAAQIAASTSKPLSAETQFSATTHLDTQNANDALIAARTAMTRRLRAESMPVPQKPCMDATIAAARAMADTNLTSRHTAPPISLKDVGAVPYTTMDRQMFTSRPPIPANIEEKNRADALHASAVAMAKGVYDHQQKMLEAKRLEAEKLEAEKAAQQNDVEISSSASDDGQPIHLTALQAAAYRQAQARLAKIDLEIDRTMDGKGHHGMNPLSRHFTIKGKLRKRSVSDGVVIEDRRRSQQLMKQISLFPNRLSEADELKQWHDQELLRAAAERNAYEQLKVIDEEVAAKRGKAPPATLTQWELNARIAAAEPLSSQGEAPKRGKVNVGAGMHVDQEDIDIIAARRIQPILEEINAKAELEHVRRLELQHEAAKRKEEREVEKARQREIQDNQNTIRQLEKQRQKERKAEEKKEAKLRKEEERAAKVQQKRLSRAEGTGSALSYQRTLVEPRESIITVNSSGQPVKVPRPSTQDNQMTVNAEKSDEDSKSPPNRLYNWIKSRILRRAKSPVGRQGQIQTSHKGFIGGASLTGYHDTPSFTSFDNRSASVRAVAMAGRYTGSNPSRTEGGVDGNSFRDSDSDDEIFQYAIRTRPVFTPPRALRTASPAQSQGSVRDSRFHEDI
ncbi:hypothetical protein GGR50DRAFT_694996 [Xylaria sp. CBS 124048]|nr:hypothetical protein GGR50DRAFT_694996 [Xylaria sp. CBS 124048]